MTDKKIKIMVVEDEELLLEVIEKKLVNSGITPILCKSGEEALHRLEDREDRPDIIWLDYHLKGMNGMEFIEQLNQNPEIKNIPIIVVSNSANEETSEKMIAAGAKKFLVKAQYRLEDILFSIKNYLETMTSDTGKEKK